jgi:hypothetical protein
LARVDNTNIGELFFGVTSRHGDGALIISDRIVDYTVERLWPIVAGSAFDDLPVSEHGIASFVQKEVSEALPVQSINALTNGAKNHRKLAQLLAEIDARRGCGFSVQVPSLPWNGLSARSKQLITRAAEKNDKRHCPKMTREDASRLMAASDRLSSDEDFSRSMGELSAWLARAVTVHEARHAADETSQLNSKDHAPACPSCPASMGPTERSEASAYLAAFATAGYGYVSLLQACGVNVGQAHSNGAGLSYVLHRVVPEGCEQATPTDLYQRARDVEQELFGRSDSIVLPEAFPKILSTTVERTAPSSEDSHASSSQSASHWLMLRQPSSLYAVSTMSRISSADSYVRL